MRTAIIQNIFTGERFNVHATTEHPDSHYGKAVWVDDNNHALFEVDGHVKNPFFHIVSDSGPEAWF